MPYIALTVTQKVIEQVNRGEGDQRQIAVKDASPELLQEIRTATKNNRIRIRINGEFELLVRDTGAIWFSHQSGLQAEDFTSFYDLLARRPDRSVPFTCEIISN